MATKRCHPPDASQFKCILPLACPRHAAALVCCYPANLVEPNRPRRGAPNKVQCLSDCAHTEQPARARVDRVPIGWRARVAPEWPLGAVRIESN